MTKPNFNTSTRVRQHGMTLIEVLVGLAIALIAMLVMFQIFTLSSERSRTTSSGNEAQIAGNLGMFQLERDLQQAGLGFHGLPSSTVGAQGSVAGCTVHAHNSTLATSDFSFPLAPVQIIDGAGVVPDQVAVMYGSSPYFVPRVSFQSATNSSNRLSNRGGFQQGDNVILTDNSVTSAGAACGLVELTSTADLDNFTVNHAESTSYTHFYTGASVTSTLNAGSGTATFVGANGWAYTLGPTPSRNLWRVTSAGAASPSNLVWRNTLRSDTENVVTEGIADLQAQYGVDGDAVGAAGYGQIAAAEWSKTTPTDWTRLLAVRFGLLSRSQQYEKDEVTTVAPTWAAGSVTFAMRNVDGTTDSHPGGVNDWRHYRYRVYEAVVPLRNLIWGTAP